MATKPPIGPSAAPVTVEALDVRVAIDLDSFYGRLLNETRALLTDNLQKGLTGDELIAAMESGLNDLGDTLINQMGRSATSEAFNLGRNIAAQEVPDDIQECVRTEVLDLATCPECKRLDGFVAVFNSDEYFDKMPPNYCDGGDFCRGFWLYRLNAA